MNETPTPEPKDYGEVDPKVESSYQEPSHDASGRDMAKFMKGRLQELYGDRLNQKLQEKGLTLDEITDTATLRQLKDELDADQS